MQLLHAKHSPARFVAVMASKQQLANPAKLQKQQGGN